MASHHEIIDFIENIRAEMPARLHGFYEEAVDRALEQQQKRGRDFAHQIIKNSPVIRKEFQRQQQEEGILAIFILFVGLIGGAALMYLFDPDRGEQRRASLLNQFNQTADQVKSEANSVAHQVSDTVKDTSSQVRDQANQANQQVRDQAGKAVSSAAGAVKETAGQVSAAVSDTTLIARVRAEVARGTYSPGAVDVTVNQGVVTLKGQVAASEVKGLVEKVQAVPGVKSVDNRLEIHDATPSNGTH